MRKLFLVAAVAVVSLLGSLGCGDGAKVIPPKDVPAPLPAGTRPQGGPAGGKPADAPAPVTP